MFIFFKNKSDDDWLILAISVAIYADRKTHEKEIECALEALEDRVGNHRKKIDNLLTKIEKNVSLYEKDFGLFLKDKTAVIREILENGKWELGKLIEKMVHADGVVTNEEGELLSRVIECVRAREAALMSLQKIYQEIKNEE